MQPRPPLLQPMWPLFRSSLVHCRQTPFKTIPYPETLPTSPHNYRQTRTIRSIVGKHRKAYSRFNNSPDLPKLGATAAAALARKAPNLPLRTGALATKKGMTAVYDAETGKRLPVTVLQLDRVQVVAHKTRSRHGYNAVCIGSGWRRPQNVGGAMMGVFSKTKYEDEHGGMVGLSPKKDVKEFRVKDEDGLLPIGTIVGADWFQIGQFVDARSHTKGKGFQGGMKRHGFSGQPASHGVSLTHRSMGSAGGSQGSGSRVHPGKRMAGNMGGERHTAQNLKVLMTDAPNGIVVVNGAVSGPNGCLVMIQDAIKKPWPQIVPNPTTTADEASAAGAAA